MHLYNLIGFICQEQSIFKLWSAADNQSNPSATLKRICKSSRYFSNDFVRVPHTENNPRQNRGCADI